MKRAMGHPRIIGALNCRYAFMPRKRAHVIRSSAGDRAYHCISVEWVRRRGSVGSK